jgi:ferredoxin-type protein NapH
MPQNNKYLNRALKNKVQLFGFLFGTGIFYFLATLPPIILKRFPMPWLVCWSDPFAPGACPAGTFQHFFNTGHFPFFALGIFLLIGALFGRMVCGWLCPFGYLQDIVYRMRSITKWIIVSLFAFLVVYLVWTSPMFAPMSLRNMIKSNDIVGMLAWAGRYLGIFGAIFVLFFLKFKKFTISVKLSNWGRFFFFLFPFLIFPLFVVDPVLNTGGPWFCKVCPSGTTFAAIPQFLINALPKDMFPLFGLARNSPFIPYGMASYQDIRGMGQVMFGLKISSLILLLWVTMLSKRVFCKFACPIGFIYSGFNYFSAVRVVVDKEKCKGEKCNVCWKVCPMDIKLYEHGATSHCIGCLECVDRCPFKAAQLVRPSFLNFMFSRNKYAIAPKK